MSVDSRSGFGGCRDMGVLGSCLLACLLACLHACSSVKIGGGLVCRWWSTETRLLPRLDFPRVLT